MATGTHTKVLTMAETVASDRTASEPSYPLAPSIHAMAAEETPMATFMEKLDELNTMPSDRTPLRHSPYSTTSPLMALSAAFIGMMPTMRTMMETKNNPQVARIDEHQQTADGDEHQAGHRGVAFAEPGHERSGERQADDHGDHCRQTDHGDQIGVAEHVLGDVGGHAVVGPQREVEPQREPPVLVARKRLEMVADGNSAGAPIHAIARFHGRDLMRIREGEPVAERDHHGDRPEEDAPAEGRTAEELTPDTGKPVSKLNLGRFGAGFIFFCIVFMMSGTIGSTVLLPARFNTLGIGQGETILGTMNSIGIIFALISNVIFGSLSDASHSRFGKRTPWIIIGGPIAGIGFYLTSISPTLPTIVASWSLLQISLNCMIAPCVAILSDRVPQKYRGSMSAFYGAGQIVGQSMGTIIGSAFIDAPKTGFMIDTICWCLCGIGTVLLLPRELSAATADAERFDIRQIAMQFRPPTKGARDFYLALVGRLMLIFGYNMIVGYQLYVCMKYIGQDAKTAASTVSTMAVITMVVPLVVPLVSGPISDRIGKRKLPVFVSSTIIAIGIAVPWVLKSQFSMFVYAALMGLGYGIYMVVDQALNVDVLPNPNEAGKALGILNLANTLGQVIAPIVVSSIVVATGGYFLVFPIAIAAVTIGAVVILFIKKVK